MVNANPCARPEFIWRFYSCQKRHYHFVIAPTEDEARSQHFRMLPVFSLPAFLPICAILSVTGGLPVNASAQEGL